MRLINKIEFYFFKKRIRREERRKESKVRSFYKERIFSILAKEKILWQVTDPIMYVGMEKKEIVMRLLDDMSIGYKCEDYEERGICIFDIDR